MIFSALDMPREIVSKWRKRFYEGGLPGLEERLRGGRPQVPSRMKVDTPGAKRRRPL